MVHKQVVHVVDRGNRGNCTSNRGNYTSNRGNCTSNRGAILDVVGVLDRGLVVGRGVDRLAGAWL